MRKIKTGFTAAAIIAIVGPAAFAAGPLPSAPGGFDTAVSASTLRQEIQAVYARRGIIVREVYIPYWAGAAPAYPSYSYGGYYGGHGPGYGPYAAPGYPPHSYEGYYGGHGPGYGPYPAYRAAPSYPAYPAYAPADVYVAAPAIPAPVIVAPVPAVTAAPVFPYPLY
jgi:hypothetical protein